MIKRGKLRKGPIIIGENVRKRPALIWVFAMIGDTVIPHNPVFYRHFPHFDGIEWW